MKRALVFLAVYTGVLALVVVLFAVALFVYTSTGHATGIAFTSRSIPLFLLIVLLPGMFAGWLTRRLLRSKTNTLNAN